MTLEQLFDKMTFTPSGERISGGVFVIVCENVLQWQHVIPPSWDISIPCSKAIDPYGNKWYYLRADSVKNLMCGWQISGAVFLVQPSWEEQGLAMVRARNGNGVSRCPVVTAIPKPNTQEIAALYIHYEYIE